MSFLKFADPVKREQTVKEFLAIKKNICANELAEKTGKIELRADLSEFFEPVTETQKETQKAITEGLEPIKKGIKEFPQGIAPYLKHFSKKEPFILPPDYSFPLTSTLKEDDYDTEFGVYRIKDKLFMGKEPVDTFVGRDGSQYINIGDNNYLLTEGLYYLLALKDLPEGKITGIDYSMYRRILKDTNTMYVDNDPENNKSKLEDDPEVTKSAKWQFFIKPAWDDLQKELKKKEKRTGKGVKKVVIPSDPNALLEKLDLLMASKAAGNTGMRNELVSVCDKLKRQGIFDSNIYKKIMSLL